MAIHNRHDFHAFSAFGGADFCSTTFGHNKGRVDEAFFLVQRASVAKLVGNIGQNSTQDLIATPSLKPPMFGWLCGSMCHCAPVLSIHSPASSTRRVGIGLWPGRPSGICSSGK